jgi:hypothetical protein
MNAWRDEARTQTAIAAITAARNRLRVVVTRHRFDHVATCTRCKARHTTTHPAEAIEWAETHTCHQPAQRKATRQ